MEKIRIKCPTTTANLGAGFDIFGLALKEPSDVMEMEKIDSGVVIENEGYEIPKEPEKNCAGMVALKMLKFFNIKEGVKIRIKKNIEVAKGLGSSAASAAGAVFAMNGLFNLKLTNKELIKFASYGEIVASGIPVHYEQITSCILGGFNIIYSVNPLEVANFRSPENLGIIIVIPNAEKGSTKVAREILPKLVPLKSSIFNVGNASLVAAGFASKNIELIKKGMNDCIVEPARAKAGILREFFRLKKLGRKLDVGVAASGAGPAIAGFVEKERRKEVAKAMVNVFKEKGYKCKVYLTEPGVGIVNE